MTWTPATTDRTQRRTLSRHVNAQGSRHHALMVAFNLFVRDLGGAAALRE